MFSECVFSKDFVVDAACRLSLLILNSLLVLVFLSSLILVFWGEDRNLRVTVQKSKQSRQVG